MSAKSSTADSAVFALDLRASTFIIHSADSPGFSLDLRTGFASQTVALPNSAPTKVLSGTLGSTLQNGQVTINLAGAGLDSAKDYVLEFAVEPRTTAVAVSRPDGSFGASLALGLTQLATPAAVAGDVTVDLPNRWLVPVARGATSVSLDQAVQVNWLQVIVSARSKLEAFVTGGAVFSLPNVLLSSLGTLKKVQALDLSPWGFAQWPAAGYTIRVHERGTDGMPVAGTLKATGQMWLGRLTARTTASFTQGLPPLLLLHGFASDALAFAGPGGDFSSINYLAGNLGRYRPVYTLDVPNVGDIVKSSDLLALGLTYATEAHAQATGDVLAHSMGGLITRFYRQNDGSKLRKYATMGSPLEGTIYGYLADGGYKQSAAGLLAKILQRAGVQNEIEVLGPIGGLDSEAAPQLAYPQRTRHDGGLGLVENTDSSVAANPDYLAIAGSKDFKIEGWLNLSIVGTKLPDQQLSSNLAQLSANQDMIEKTARMRDLWIQTLIMGSDGLASYKSAGKREVGQVANLYVHSNHTGYNSPPGIFRGNDDLVSMMGAIDAFFKGVDVDLAHYTTVAAPLSSAQSLALVFADTTVRTMSVVTNYRDAISGAIASIRIGTSNFMIGVADSAGRISIAQPVLNSAITAGLASGQTPLLVLSAPNCSEKTCSLGGGSVAAAEVAGFEGQTTQRSTKAVTADQVVLPAQITLQVDTGYNGPLGGSIAINSQADTTSSATLSLTISARNATEMRLQVDGEIRDWEPYATQRSVVLQNTDPGIKSVSVEFRSNNGTIGSSAHDTILLVPTTGTGGIQVTNSATPGIRILVDGVERVADGSGLIASVTPGNHTVQMLADGYVFSPDTQTVAVSAGNTTAAAFTVASAAVAPSVVSNPSAATVLAGGVATFESQMAGSPAPALQWQVSTNGGSAWANLSDGGIYAGATTGFLALTGVTAGMTGYQYRCVATNSAGTANSGAATLTVNVVPAVTTQPVGQTVTAAGNTSFSAAASGAPAPTLQWQVSTNGGSTWTNVSNGGVYAGATTVTLAITGATAGMSGYQYRCVASSTAGTATSNAVTLTVTSSSYLANLSVRVAMAAGQTLIVGFVVDGGAKPMLVRAAGPVLNKYGLTGVVDPQLKLFNGSSTQVAANDNWDAALASVFATLGAFPFDATSKDAALQQTINGPHSAQATATGPGAVLVEAYDAGPNDGRKLVNLSARFQVGTGDNILIAGFVLSGTGTRQLLIRAVGPTLTNYGVTGVLTDPQLSVFDVGTPIASNNDWSSSLSTTFTTLGAFALNAGSKDAALVVTLQAGKPYSVQVSGVGNTTGEALVEIYLMP
jgi:pimeloyl-ACP methyl ester carboxylesterase